jgi:hypothetical protein
MAYSVPELLLVGVARNLVLGTSCDPNLKDDVNCLGRWPIDIDYINCYDTIEGW